MNFKQLIVHMNMQSNFYMIKNMQLIIVMLIIFISIIYKISIQPNNSYLNMDILMNYLIQIHITLKCKKLNYKFNWMYMINLYNQLLKI